jgi:MFS-type transporter involved in bile tolerance (Atg22 family)
MMLAGALAGLLLGRVPLSLILAVNAAAGIASYALLRGLPYTATHLGPAAAPAPASVWHGVAEGGRWLLARPRLAVFFTCTLLPFVVVMAANYLFPVYVTQTLAAGPEWFAGGEITFAAGAILAGLLLPRLISRHSAATTVPVTMLVFLAGLLLLAAVHLPLPYLCAGALLGFGNAGCRVARSALLLHLVPNAVMGRVGGFYQVLDRVLRTALVLAMGIIDAHGPPVGFALLAAVLLLALAGALRTRAAARPAIPA